MNKDACWIETYTGRRFYLLEPTPDQVFIEDIAHALANQCRFTGHVRRFYCPTEEQLILTSDLHWTPAANLEVGTPLLGFDEQPIEKGQAGNLRRKFRPSRVTHIQRIKQPIIRLEIADGSTVRASSGHPWLVATKQSRNQRWLTSARIAEDIQNGSKRYLHKFMRPWFTNLDYETGRLSAFFDGEGHLSFTNRGGVQMGIAQKPGEILNEMEALLKKNAFDYRPSPTGTSTISLQIRGGWREVMRLLGQIRPTRLLSKFQSGLVNNLFNKQLNGVQEPLEIIKAYQEPSEWVVGIETSTHTYFCEGFGAHNSVAEHSWHVSMICDSLWGLLHDASEAYISDLSRPLKHCSDLGVLYQQAEVKIMDTVRARFNLAGEQPQSVHNADRAMLLREKQELLTRLPWGTDKAAWDAEGLAIDREIHCWNPDVAEEKFLRRFKEIS